MDALDLGDAALLQEELGDVLMQVVFHARIEEEAGRFGWADVCDTVCRKLLWRHPHIFGPAPGAEGINDWEELKTKEKGRVTLAADLEAVPRAMPALMRAAKLHKRAQRHGAAVPPASAQETGRGCRGAAGRRARQRRGRTGSGPPAGMPPPPWAAPRASTPNRPLQRANDAFVRAAQQENV